MFKCSKTCLSAGFYSPKTLSKQSNTILFKTISTSNSSRNNSKYKFYSPSPFHFPNACLSYCARKSTKKSAISHLLCASPLTSRICVLWVLAWPHYHNLCFLAYVILHDALTDRPYSQTETEKWRFPQEVYRARASSSDPVLMPLPKSHLSQKYLVISV